MTSATPKIQQQQQQQQQQERVFFFSCTKKYLTKQHRATANDDEEMQLHLAAKRLLHLNSTCCEQCGTTKTPMWRTGPFDVELDRPLRLCNACGLRFKAHFAKIIESALLFSWPCQK